MSKEAKMIEPEGSPNRVYNGLPAVTCALRVSQIDVTIPFYITEKIYDKMQCELKSEKVNKIKYGEHIGCVVDITPWGNFIYGSKTRKEQTKELRFEIDNRYITNEQALQMIQAVICNCR